MAKSGDPTASIEELKQALADLVQTTANGSLSNQRRRRLEADLREVIDNLAGLLNQIDPIRQPTSVFDPSNPKVIGRFVALALVAQARRPLSNVATDRFYGSGVYSIYYIGNFPAYLPVSNSETPIYVGQASPRVSNARTAREQGDQLVRRLDEHRKNIERATMTLDIKDFEFRSLVVQSGWETAAEDYLIHLFRPIWNNETNVLYGIGKHGDSAGTRANKRSPWDTFHPGRSWAGNPTLQDAKSPTQISTELQEHFSAVPVFQDLDSVLESFIEEAKFAARSGLLRLPWVPL